MAFLPTYQDYEKANDTSTFISDAINRHKTSDAYDIALVADEYDAQRNITVNEYARLLYSMRSEVKEDGTVKSYAARTEDFTASNNKLASNFFHRLVTQRVQYSFGNGVSFVQPNENTLEDVTKKALGEGFDECISDAATYAVLHGVSFVFWNVDKAHVFKFTEFVPLWDEFTGELRAGIRFWRLDSSKPISATFYREDGYSQWRSGADGKFMPLDKNGSETNAEVVMAYKTTVAYVPADGESVIVGEENYGSLPIIPMWASRLKQSALVGMRAHIDAYDLVKSGFANDLQDCATVYWIVKNAMGMSNSELAEFRDRLKLEHIAKVDGMDGAEAVPYTQEIPYQARQALLKELRDGLYEDFGALDVHTVAAGATNDHIDAAYQPMDENASEIERWAAKCIRRLLDFAIEGSDEPIFTRQRISNQKEQVDMVVQEAQWLDTRTILQLLPNISPDQVSAILEAIDSENMARFSMQPQQPVYQQEENTQQFGE